MKDILFEMYCHAEELNLPFTNRAIIFANAKHCGQKRSNGNDYISHPLAVCRCLIMHNVIDDVALAASVLHDVIEDCGVTAEELGKYFPPATVYLVTLLSKEKNEPGETVFGRIAADTRAVLIKLADRRHNLSEAIGVFGLERLEKYVRETADFVLPAARQAADESRYYRRAITALSDQVRELNEAARLYAAKKRIILDLSGKYARLLETVIRPRGRQ